MNTNTPFVILLIAWIILFIAFILK